MTNTKKKIESMNLKFNIPKDSEDKRRLLIDLENNVGVVLKEEKGKFLVSRYKPSHPTPEPSEEWEEELKLYLTSAGDRRRTIHFIKALLAQREKEILAKIESMKEETDSYVIDAVSSTLSEAGEKREEVRE